MKQCLEKDPDERWQSAHDVARELEWIAGSSTGVTSPTVADRRSSRRRLAGGVIAGIGLAAAFFTAGFFLAGRLTAPRPVEPALARFAVSAPAGLTIPADATSAAISPDGRRLAFLATDSTGIQRLWIRDLDALSARPLAGTENAMFQFWSPDSRFVAFFAEGKLRKVPAGGGSAEVICDAPNGRGGSWNSDGVIVFAPLIMGPIVRVSAAGGEVVEVVKPDVTRGETGLRFPGFLPDGRHFLYVSLPRKTETFDVYVGALDGSRPTRIMSAGGVLAYGATTPPETRLVWLDRAGHTLDTVALPPDRYARPYLAPDNRRAIVTKSSSPTSYDLWLVDLERPVASRLTFDGLVGSTALGDSFPVWSPDGSLFLYGCGDNVCLVPTTAAGQPEPIIRPSEGWALPSGWSPDGKYIVLSQIGEGAQYDLWLLPQQGNRTPRQYLRTPFHETTAAISPDGRWLAHDSDETGTSEIYVRSFPEPGAKHRISIAGGIRAQWSRDGTELLIWTSSLFSAAIGPVYSVDVQTTPTFKAGTPRVLFTPRGDLMGLAATSDLKRFLAAVPVEGASPASITVILN